MDLPDFGNRFLKHVPPRVISLAERYLQRIPLVRERISKETDAMLAGMEGDLKPYRGQLPTHTRLPEQGLAHEEVLREMEQMHAREEARWKEGYVSGAVYHGDSGHIDFLNRVYALNSQSNPLHVDLWPSATKYEAEVVAMTANLLGATEANAGRPEQEHVCGSLSSGGTESIMLATKTYRDQARAERGILHPQMVAPVSAHPAFDKAAHYFGLKMVRVPVGRDYRADVEATRRALTRDTVMVVGSAPSFPHGVIDPIEELSDLARERGIGFHTDACLGGFVLPWARELGYPVPGFDFRLPGVTSMSADTHKFGYAAKGTSVVLYRGRALRAHQYFTSTEWSGGLYFSPTFSGSRPGALIAAAWASLLATGDAGYRDATRRILETADMLKRGIRAIPGLHVLGEPLFVIAFGSETLNIYQVLERMSHQGWNLNGLHKPAAVHLCVTQRHTQPGVAERFLADLRAAVEQVRANPHEQGGMAPVYGMAGTVPFRGVLSDLLKKYMDLIARV